MNGDAFAIGFKDISCTDNATGFPRLTFKQE
jgi:hypothetical protein